MGFVKRHWAWFAAAALFLVLPVIFTSGFALTLLNGMGIVIIFAVAYNMLLGQGGMLSFGHAVYFGLAGYSAIHILNAIGAETIPYFPVSLVPLLGGLVGMFFGVIIGFMSTRRAGTVFAMISLGFMELATALTLVLVVFFNGEEGIQTDRFIGPEPFGITFGPEIQVYYLIAVWCLISMITMYMLTRTPFGRMSNAVRDNPERVQFVGYNPQRVRWLAFTLSSFFAGIAGGLYAINFEYVGFEAVGLAKSGAVLFMVYIGGVGHFLGPILGAIIFSLLEGTLSEFTQAWFLYLGLIFCIIVLFAPGGVAGLIMMHEPIWKVDSRLLRGMAAPYLLGILTTLLATTGVVGLIELLYFRSTKPTDATEFRLFGVLVDTASPVPWLVCAAIGVAGIFLCRATYPRMVESWHRAMEQAKLAAARAGGGDPAEPNGRIAGAAKPEPAR